MVFGAEPAELSLLHFLFYLNSGEGFESLVETRNGAQQTRFVHGAQTIAIRMAAALGERVVLGAPVEAIAQSADGVTVRSAAGEHRAARAIVAVPPALAARIHYSPGLPVLRDQLTQRFPMGATIKCVATYRRAFWREAGLSGEALSTDGPVTATFDDTSHDGAQPALLGFLVGREARALGAQPLEARRAAVIQSFARLFGKEAEQYVDYFDLDWSNEVYTRGCPVAALPPGAWTQFGAAWRAPVGRLHFAGTETASEWNGYMEGAVESGERAAAEIEAASDAVAVAG
jgi:monoamine oxidase